MQNSTYSSAVEEPNFWMRQAAELERLEIEADAQFLLEERPFANVDRDYGWAATLIIWWLAWILVAYWKVAPGGIASIPLFLILFAIGTTVAITAWMKTR